MRLTVQTTTLKAAVDQVGKLVRHNATLPALSAILLEADGGLTLTATNLESRAIRTIGADVQDTGVALVPAKRFQDFVGALHAGEAIISFKDNRLTVRAGRAVLELPTLDVDEFPPATSFDQPSCSLTLPAAVFLDAVGSAIHATAPDESRPVLSGVLLRTSAGRLITAAADGFRLAVQEVDGLGDLDDVTLIVHGKALAGILSPLSASDSVTLTVDTRGSAIAVESGVGTWHLRLIDGQFPDFRRIIPRETAYVFTADRAELLAQLRLVASVAAEHDQITNLTLNGDTLTVSARNQSEAADTALEVEVERGESVTIKLNNRYTRDALDSLAGERVTVEIVGPTSPCLIHAGDRQSSLRVVMPMHERR